MRQLDSAKLIPSLKTIESLIRYSEQSRLVSLVPKLNELMENKRTDVDEQQVNLYTALPSKQSTLQRNDLHTTADTLTPLIIDSSIFEKPEIKLVEDKILDEIEPNRFGDAEVVADQSVRLDEEDELLKLVTNDDAVRQNIKNPFKV